MNKGRQELDRGRGVKRLTERSRVGVGVALKPEASLNFVPSVLHRPHPAVTAVRERESLLLASNTEGPTETRSLGFRETQSSGLWGSGEALGSLG